MPSCKVAAIELNRHDGSVTAANRLISPPSNYSDRKKTIGDSPELIWDAMSVQTRPNVVILSAMPVRLGPKDLSYLGDAFRPAPAG
jgi:hypothetical protein